MLPLVENLKGEQCKVERDRLIALLEGLRAELSEAEKAIDQKRTDWIVASQRRRPRPKDVSAARARLKQATSTRDQAAIALTEVEGRLSEVETRLRTLYRPRHGTLTVGFDTPSIRDLRY